jgi:hypothetical protein
MECVLEEETIVVVDVTSLHFWVASELLHKYSSPSVQLSLIVSAKPKIFSKGDL